MAWNPTPLERIERLRRQLHVHSILYYHMDAAYISDAVFDRWSKELLEKYEQYPEFVKQGDKWQMFEDWTGDTGMHLPPTKRVVSLAHDLLRYRERMRIPNV